MKRIAPDVGPSDQPSPHSREALEQAEADRLHQMSVYGLDEEDFPDETLWLEDDVPADE